MREHWKRLFPLAALLLALLAPHCRAAQPQVRGVWVSTVLNLDYPSAQGLDKAALQQELDQMLDTAEAAGFNAIFFQVRPCADSFYPSQIFPYSVYLLTRWPIWWNRPTPARCKCTPGSTPTG